MADREVLAFDLYGTLVDPIAISSELDQVLGESDGSEAARLWRLKQLEYSFRLTAMGHSMGSTIGIPVAAFDPRIKAYVFSGSGGSILLADPVTFPTDAVLPEPGSGQTHGTVEIAVHNFDGEGWFMREAQDGAARLIRAAMIAVDVVQNDHDAAQVKHARRYGSGEARTAVISKLATPARLAFGRCRKSEESGSSHYHLSTSR